MKVRVIRQNQQTALVEWMEEGKLYRSIVPISELQVDDSLPAVVQVEHPEQGMDYGLDFASLIELSKVTPELFDQSLKRAGIWTAEDVREQPQVVIGAIQRVYGLDFARLVSAISRYEKEQGV